MSQHTEKIIAAGFSYGAATASLAATLQPTKYQCAVLLDPWLHIDYSSRGYEFDFPPEAFGSAWPSFSDETTSNTNPKKKGLDIPSVFINSSQFEGYKKLYGATCRLADQINNSQKNNDGGNKRVEMVVIPRTFHQNFCDVIFWLPWRLSKKVFQLGEADAYDAYETIVERTIRFLQKF